MSANRNLVILGTFTCAWVASRSACRCWLCWRSADGSSCCPSAAGSSFSSRSGSAAVQRWLATARCCSLQLRRGHNAKIRLGDTKRLWAVENRAGRWEKSKRGRLEKCTYSFSLLWLNETIAVLKWWAVHLLPGDQLFLLHSLLENIACTFWAANHHNSLIKWSVEEDFLIRQRGGSTGAEPTSL